MGGMVGGVAIRRYPLRAGSGNRPGGPPLRSRGRAP